MFGQLNIKPIPALYTHIVVGVLVLFGGHAFADEAKETQKLKKVSQQILALQNNIKSVSKQVEQLETELEQAERQLSQLKSSIQKLQNEIDKNQSKLPELEQQKAQLNQLKTAQQKAIIKQINSNYRQGQEPTLKLLLNQEDASEVSRMMRYHKYFLAARAKRIEQYQLTLNDIAKVEEQIVNTIIKLEQDEIVLNEQLSQQLQARTKRNRTLVALNSSIKSDTQKVTKLNREKQRLELVIEQLAKAANKIELPDKISPFTQHKGKLHWPVKGQLKSRFGQTRNNQIKWDGWLVKTKEGAEVSAIHYGRVIFSDYLRGHGLLIVVDHGEGYISLYAHNQVLLAETGDWVQSGAAIAKAGQTGGQQHSGLYFEIRHNGKPTNPANWLTKG